ncbi:MAG: PHP domain-containing protein [Clostridia bacterium]|nr:PHP domain-containing protein [Clostridia bacterium]
MILTGDYHTHTPYSHGKNTVGENAAWAKSLGLKQIGIADHGFAHTAFGLRRKDVGAYRKECALAQEEYGVEVLVGIEANILGTDGRTDLLKEDFENFDIYLCGKHVCVAYGKTGDFFGYGCGNFLADKLIKPSKKLIKRNTEAYINTIKNNPVDAITHLGYKCPVHAAEVAKCAADYGTYIELNSKKQHLTDEELMDIVQKTDARFIINSDAHERERVGEIKLVAEQLARLNFPMERIDNIDGRYPNFRFAQYKERGI